MKANEVRVGNWVSILGLWDRQIETIDFASSYIEGTDYKYKQLKPIPLTEEWLEKFGFEKIGKFQYSHDEFMNLKIEDGNWAEPCLDVSIINATLHEPAYITCITYAHQLQNLYFALTGEELTIKDEA